MQKSTDRLGVDREGREPLYTQIKDRLREELRAADGQPLVLSDAALMQRFGVSRMTVRNAVAELVREGVLERVPGRGTFLRQPAQLSVSLDGLERFLQEWSLPHLETRILMFRHTTAPPEVAARLQIKPASQVLAIRRLRESDGEPFVLDLRYVSSWCAAGIKRGDAERQSLFVTIAEQSGVIAHSVMQEVGAENAKKELASVLNVEIGDALLRRLVTFYTADERPMITGVSFYRSDHFSFQVRASR